MTTTPDPALAARLDALQATANLEASSPSEYALVCFDTACGQAYDNGQLITLSAHTEAVQAAVAKAVEAEREAAAMVMDMDACDLEEDALRFRGGTNPHHAGMAKAETARKYAAAIRSRGVAG